MSVSLCVCVHACVRACVCACACMSVLTVPCGQFPVGPLVYVCLHILL